MNRLTGWWHELPGAAKFRLYTRVTLQFAMALLVLVVVVTNGMDALWSAPGIVIAGIAAILALHAQPEFATDAVSHRWALPTAIALLGGVWVAYAVITRLAVSESVAEQARMAGSYTAIVAVFSVVSFLPRHKWWVVAGIGLATGLVFASSLSEGLIAALVGSLAGAFAVGTTLLTVWGLRVVEELERARVVETELQVAEERLRFARDLHDVVGRGFSAIAVKSELAAVLSRAGDAERAAAEMDEVKTLAVESMGQMRQLVRGYRGIDLRAEVAGARSLLAAVGCRLVVEGDAARVPARYHEVAAWVVREGTTNIVEHSAATSAVLSLGDAGMSLRNNCPRGTSGERSGLRGLAERLAATGATLEVNASSDAFELEIHWEKK